MSENAFLPFVDEASAGGGGTPERPSSHHQPPSWQVLVVDDDADVHESTAYALRHLEIAGRQLELLHAYSSVEGLELLKSAPDVAVILLDVVMETEHAGLAMVDRIRNELGLHNTRIILRTGQPGQAPEIETIRQYDINDYKMKSELTRAKLYATLTGAIRSFDQLRRLEASRRGLEQIVAASHQLIAEQGLQTFAEGVIIQIASLLGVDPEGLVCASIGSAGPGEPEQSFIVIAAAGPYRHLIQRQLSAIDNPEIVQSLTECLAQRRTQIHEHSLTLYFGGDEERAFAAYIASSTPLQHLDEELLEVFCTNISLCAANVMLVDRLRDHAFVDRMLGIPNRTALIQHLDERIRDQTPDPGLVLGMVDVDQFAETNDMFGHRYGDLLLKAIARRLTESLSSRCYIARVAGNTFAIVGHAGVVSPEELCPLFEAPFMVESLSRRLSVSMSFVRCDEVPASDGSEWLKDASIAMKRAKAAGQGRIEYYTPALGADSKERTLLLHGLQRAFEHDRLFLVYQPQVSLETGAVLGLEALLRWRSEDGSLVPPDRFIPVAERSGLIVSLGTWVLRSALYDLHRLHQAGYGQLRMAVNVSAVQFGQPDFLHTLDQALADKAVTADRLELEVTESVAIVGMERVATLMREIRSRRVAVAIDDFGTGFSSLSYLDCLPADRLKIDRAFVNLLETDRPGARIARMIVPLGHQLGMKVLAEGVETESQARLLREMGCDEAQGYLYGRPMPLPDLFSWLQTHAPRPQQP
ncbi:MAG: EAL domain-containing protein [Curvibacter sp.]|nr:EAL domain-containing protein [Curvibacter sp.]